jgi:hypothetical protein
MSLTDISSPTFIDEVSGTLQGAVGYAVVNATNGLTGFSLTPTEDRLEVASDGAITGIGDGGKLAILVSESDLGWSGFIL